MSNNLILILYNEYLKGKEALINTVLLKSKLTVSTQSSATFSRQIFEQKRDCSQSTKFEAPSDVVNPSLTEVVVGCREELLHAR